jgi:hypothetical protein
MAETEKLPGIGKVKKTWVYVGIAAVAVIVGFAYYRHRQAGGSSSSTAAAAAATDPATGYPTGSAQDLAALQAQSEASSGYGSYGGSSTGTDTGQQLYYDPADGLYDLTSPYTGTTTGTGTGTTGTANTGPGTFTDDAYWVSYAEENVTGYAASAVQGALAAYLAGIPLTTTQMSIYQAAIAVAGQPPSPGPTPTLATQSTSGTGSGTSSSKGGAITVVPQGFHATVSGLTITLGWTNPPLPAGEGPVRSIIVAYGQSATSLPYQQTVGAGATSTTITFNSGAGSAGLTHYFEAWYDPANTGGPHAGPISAKTT